MYPRGVRHVAGQGVAQAQEESAEGQVPQEAPRPRLTRPPTTHTTGSTGRRGVVTRSIVRDSVHVNSSRTVVCMYIKKLVDLDSILSDTCNQNIDRG